MKKRIWICIVCAVLLSLTGCKALAHYIDKPPRMKPYYKDKSNYVFITIEVCKVTYDYDAIYFCTEEIPQGFSERDFVIRGDSYPLVCKRGIDDVLYKGVKVKIVTAPRYFYDGYLVPVVAIWIDDKEYLSFDEGYENLLKWLDE